MANDAETLLEMLIPENLEFLSILWGKVFMLLLKTKFEKAWPISDASRFTSGVVFQFT